ncbi:MAG: hypothetical protein Q4P32_05675 [Micrococcales bacterium]|nr:hypothetical protein [Micrococcales bacterium]
MMNAIGYVVVIAGMFLAMRCLVALMEWGVAGRVPRRLQPLMDKVDAVRHPPPEPMPHVLHELELARLAAEIQKVRDANQPGLATRVRACTAAYDDVLVRCAHDLGLEAPSSLPPLTDRERFEVETELMSAGLSW